MNNLSGYDAYWFHATTDWQTFEYSDYYVKISQVEGNTVALSGLFGPDFIGVFNAETSCIEFAPQALYGGTSYYFCKETRNEDATKWTLNLEDNVVAPIDAEGNISFDGWTIIYDYGTGSYFSYFSLTSASLSPAVVDPAEICGTYNVDNFFGFEAYWFSSSTNWSKFSYSDYQVEISDAGNGNVYLTNLLYAGESLVAAFDPVDYTLTFPAQKFAVGNYEYIFCPEEWDGSNIVCNMDSSIVADFDEDGALLFDGWTVLSDYGNGNYWTYFSNISSTISPYVASEIEVSLEDILGEYTVESWAGYESYWFTTADTDWHEFAYSNYTAKLEAVEDAEDPNAVGLTNLLYCNETIKGSFNPATGTVSFPAQVLNLYGYDYIFCKEEWDDNGAVCDMDTPVVATIDANRKLHLDGWTLLSDCGTYYWGYFYTVAAVLNPNFETGVQEVAAPELVNAPTEYYNLQGVRVNANDGLHGLYIVRQGNKVTKQIIK